MGFITLEVNEKINYIHIQLKKTEKTWDKPGKLQ